MIPNFEGCDRAPCHPARLSRPPSAVTRLAVYDIFPRRVLATSQPKCKQLFDFAVLRLCLHWAAPTSRKTDYSRGKKQKKKKKKGAVLLTTKQTHRRRTWCATSSLSQTQQRELRRGKQFKNSYLREARQTKSKEL